jgi:hypothetical protein
MRWDTTFSAMRTAKRMTSVMVETRRVYIDGSLSPSSTEHDSAQISSTSLPKKGRSSLLPGGGAGPGILITSVIYSWRLLGPCRLGLTVRSVHPVSTGLMLTSVIAPITYFYVTYFAVLLVHRQMRDDENCEKKCGIPARCLFYLLILVCVDMARTGTSTRKWFRIGSFLSCID